MLNTIRRKISDWIIYNRDFKRYKGKKKIFYMSTPIHGNMGDQAIVYATNKYLEKYFSEYEIIEVYRKDIKRYVEFVKKIINDDNDIIVLHGGGNLGNIWVEEEYDRRFIIETFPNNKILSMPQTISFTNDKFGEEELRKTIKSYSNHKKLVIVAREKISFEIMKKYLTKNKIIINPDMVLLLSNMYKANNSNRKGIMTCLRNDKESVIGNEKNYFLDTIIQKFKDVYVYDTVIKKTVLREQRERELIKMFDKFRRSKLVITDRLHGMVFSAITKTPCIVTKSLDHKVIGTYEWIKDLNYIKLVKKLDYGNIESIINELLKLENFNEIDFENMYFKGLRDKLV
jgi:pyruvyl transferase EpsI